MNENNVAEKEYLAKIFSRWLNISEQELEAEMKGIDSARAIERLEAPRVLPIVKLLRKVLQDVLVVAGQKRQKWISDILQRMRRPKLSKMNNIAGLFFVEIRKDIQQNLNRRGIVPRTAPGAICITHDIDWVDCYNFTDELAELEASYRINATFNFLTDWNYRIDKKLIVDLIDRGAEIGLHGSDHDIALAYRRKDEIKEKIKRGMAKLPVAVQGFRSPALSTSQDLFEVLEELGFKYDSSLYALSPFGQATESLFPYQFPGRKLWEVPLTIQDTLLFRNLRFSESQAWDFVRALMHKTLGANGVFVFCGHPGILKQHLSFFKRLLQECNQIKEKKDDLRITTISRLIDGR
ncbi:MAG: polysaccharide deacetylase family protein [Candidatus Omnitrophota bacterium]